jgi:Putative MetA-pathway of phenol degradation
MRVAQWSFSLLLCAFFLAEPLAAQLPFYTDDPAVTEPFKFHFEFFNEYDKLQRQYPNLHQNTSNYKFNVGLPHGLEVDLDFPYLAILRAVDAPNSTGGGDLDLGIKWEYHKETPRVPALGVSLYIEFPTGDATQQLGSGLTDYWLNFVGQKSLTDKTRINANLGYLFAGNSSTGVLGIESARGHVYTGGVSLLHDFTKRLTLGTEIYGGYTDNDNLSRTQLQAMIGGEYEVRRGLSVTFGVLGGKYVASPLFGAQLGFSVDLPDLVRPPAPSPLVGR